MIHAEALDGPFSRKNSALGVATFNEGSFSTLCNTNLVFKKLTSIVLAFSLWDACKSVSHAFSPPWVGASRMWFVKALEAPGVPQTRFKSSRSRQCFVRGGTSFRPCSLPQFVEASGALIWLWADDHSWDLCSLGFS